jgi:hypothetical protein
MPPPAARTVRWHPLALAPLALTAWVYYPITRVFFWADDFYHLGRLTDENPFAWVLTPFAGHNLVLRNLAFLGSWHLFGFHSEGWYWTSLLTHLVNVWLLFEVLCTLTGRVGLACFGAPIWGMCPLAVATVGWYAVYGQAMVATLLLLVLAGLGRLAVAGKPVPRRTALLWYALLLAGTTCFGTGIGVTLVFPAVLFLMLPAGWRQRDVRIAYLALPAVTLGVYLGSGALAEWIEPLAASDKVNRAVAASGLRAAPAMLVPLLGFAVGGVTLGHWFDPARFVDARTWVAIGAFVVGLVAVAWRGDVRTRRVALAMAALAVGIYGVLAVGRAPMYSLFHVPLARAAAEPRYHYVGTIPIVVLVCLVLREVGRVGRLSAVPRGPLLAAGLVLPVVAYARSGFRIEPHAQTREYVTRTMREMVDTVAAAPPGTTVFVENGKTNPVIGPWLEVLLPGRAGLFLLVSPESLPPDRQIRFIERDPKVLEFWANRPRSRLATLLVPPPRAGNAAPVGVSGG